MSDDPIKTDADEVDAGPFRLKGHHAIIGAVIIGLAAIAAWAWVSTTNIKHGGQPVPLPLEKAR